jgi:hypothetical protein
MKAIRHFIRAIIAAATLLASRGIEAQTTGTSASTSSNVVLVTRNSPNLAGVPTGVRDLITGFELLRDQFLATQDALSVQLRHATTASEREQIRLKLQANRDAFLAALRGFRQQLQEELTALKGKISHEEFLRVIDEAHNAAAEGGLSHHRGH